MANKRLTKLLIFYFLSSFIRHSDGCQIGGGLTLGPVPNIISIVDTLRGTVLSETTQDILRIESINYGGALVGTEAYLTVTHENNQLLVQTSSAFEQYEANEVALSFSATINFACNGGSTSPLILMIDITDTNNNYPEFLPTSTFNFVLTAPVPPGFTLTDCFNEIIVRDIDLTTSAIIFEIEDNPYFQLEYDVAPCPAPAVKHFKARLRSTTFIRNFREPITLRVTATDVDATGDPPLSTSGTIHISGDPQFEFPEEPVFTQTLYFATYTEEHQIILTEPISLQQGYDGNVNFALEGEFREHFELSPTGNPVTLTVATQLDLDDIEQNEIYLIVRADKEYTSGGSAVIVLQLPEVTPLRFESAQYRGSIVDNSLVLSPLVLSEGFEGVTVSAEVVGEYSASFSAVAQGNLVTVSMIPLPENIIEVNNLISISVVASNGRSEATTIVTLEIIKDDNVTPVFDKPIYTGAYDPVNGLNLEQIAFAQGFDGSVEVELLGEHREYFQLNEIGPIVSIASSTIPPELFEERHITLSLVASKARTVGANAAIIISLPAPTILSFAQDYYKGHFEEGLPVLELISIDNYVIPETTVPLLIGDYSGYFQVTNINGNLQLELRNSIPNEILQENNVFILTLEIQQDNYRISTVIVLEIVREAINEIDLTFVRPYYVGSYSEENLLEFEDAMTTNNVEGHTIQYDLDGEDAQWFNLEREQNSVRLILRDTIPPNELTRNQFIFEVTAEIQDIISARATVVISITNTELEILRFDQVSYLGQIENDQTNIGPIILTDINMPNLDLELHGELHDYFSLTPQGSFVIVALQRAIPEESLPANHIIVLDLQATAPQAVSAYATLVFEYVVDEITQPVELIFAQPFYTGSYTESEDLVFSTQISLTQGYDDTVLFEISGDQGQWFALQGTGNSRTLVVAIPIPSAVVLNNQQLVFIVSAEKLGVSETRATIVISLPNDDNVNQVLGFDRITYLGTIENGQTNIGPITLSEGYVPGVNFDLHGDLQEYFSLTPQGASVTVTLQTAIPEQSVPANRIIVLELQAIAPQAVSAYATLVFEYVVDDITPPAVELVFAQPFYTGSYTEGADLVFSTPISLTQGYDDTVLFEISGDQGQWFALQGTGNSRTLVVAIPIPSAVVLNNQQLVFIVSAEKLGVSETRATIVISLPNDDNVNQVLGFDRITYLGSIENGQTNIGPITLSEGYVPGVNFDLHGDLQEYFSLTPQGASVTVTLQTAIPEQSVPANRIIVLELQAIAPQAVSAYATLVFEYVVDDITPPAVELVFAQPFYTGSYTEGADLVFSTPISLTQGYDDTVLFEISGDQGQWFALHGTGNSRTLVVAIPIPSAVVLNNQQLVFIVSAEKLGVSETRATIVISLPNDDNVNQVLGFDRITYLGTIENGQTNIGPITLSEGYVPGVNFDLHGDLQEYFSLTPQGASVTVTLQTAIPEQSVPANRIIVLELQAIAPQAVSAYATLVFEYVVDDITPPAVELVFAQPFYTGSYTEGADLVFSTPISLTQGYDDTVLFEISGDQGQWFALQGTGNSRTLVVAIPIPSAVVLNNQQLVFIVSAEKLGVSETRATIVISLPNDDNVNQVLGFDRITYLGTIENGQTNIGPITLSEGYVPGVNFDLHGDLQEYFSLTPQGASVTVTLQTAIPEQSVPANRIIVLELQAIAPQAVSAYATLVFEYVVDDITPPAVELVFAQPFYTGSYTEGADLVFSTPISLTQGYDDTVLFEISGDQGQWFALQGTGNSRTLVVAIPIPSAVVLNNQQLVFIVSAEKLGVSETRATIVISLPNDDNVNQVLGFDRITYLGTIENGQTNIGPITLSEGYVPGVNFDLHGDLQEYFSLTPQGASVTVTLQTAIPEQSVPANRIIVLELQAIAPQAVSAYATLVFEYVVDDITPPAVELVFAQPFYTGSYTEGADLVFSTPISLTQGYDDTVLFEISGDQGQWFALHGTGNSRTLVVAIPIPSAVVLNNQQLVFIVSAEKLGVSETRATIVISLPNDDNVNQVLGFDRITYLGTIENGQTNIGPITLSEGYVPGVNFDLHGDLQEYFSLTPQGASVTVTLQTAIPEQSVPANRIIVLELQAIAPQAVSAYATLVFEYVVDDITPPAVELVFAQPFYTGSYTEGADLVFSTPISLTQGYDDTVLFEISGDQGQWFALQGTGNSRTLVVAIPIPSAVVLNNQQLVFIVSAEKLGVSETRATIVISLPNDDNVNQVLGFDRITYLGSIENGQTNIGPITLSEGYVPGVNFDLHGDLQEYFSLTPQGASVTVTLQTAIPEQSVPANRIIVLELQAIAPQAVSAYATLVFEYVVDDITPPAVELVFAQPFYTGSYTEGADLVFSTPISLTQGYDDTVLFEISGDQGQWFGLQGTGNSRTVVLRIPIPTDVLVEHQQLLFTVNAERPGSALTWATIVIALPNDSQTGADESFNKILFEGVIQNDGVYHETISLIGFEGSSIDLIGEYAALFGSDVTNGEVTVRALGSLPLPATLTHLAVELHAGSARAVLLLVVELTEDPSPTLPEVTFNSPSYAVRVTIADTGLVGQVHAFADNGENIQYTLQLDNEHLQERLSVNDLGELYLSAPVSPGLYTIQVLATTVFTQATGTAIIHLTSESITTCGGEIVMAPLVVLDRDEEEPHFNLLNSQEGCQFSLTNRWPLEQEWLYVDETGLHTRSIDREHPSIAFMALSQVQVEIVLHCDSDETRTKRSLNSRSDLTDYGSSNWVLTDSIPYNSRRSLVNLIVNDINDNAPIFLGKEQEPIAAGYPVTHLQERVLPRSLIELQATDADIGENAELLYWSNEAALAVAPTTGFVHVRDGAILEHDVRLTIHATDRNGHPDGLTGSIDIIVKLLDESNIAVVTIRNAFLDNERDILTQLTESVGYDIKVLRSVVISDEDDAATRNKRDVTSATGASLQLYVYGLIEREPVSIDQLTTDITNAVIAQVIIASTVSLEDHLAGQEICVISGRDTGLLVATIVLSVLLFIIILLILVWFFLRWRKNQNYEQFSDANSMASRIDLDQMPKPLDVAAKPRLNIEELKKSERRLQEMLEAPIPEVTVEPTPARKESVLDIPSPQDPGASIVIQSIDKLKTADDSSDDEYGERIRSKRKSVVTFNENVEKIIHVEDHDAPLEDEKSGFEIYKF